jgi:hypothetical protein
LQWADADSAQAWYELLNHTEAPALLVLGSYRSDEAEESLFLQAWQPLTTSVFHKLESRQVAVEPLTREQCLEVASISGRESNGNRNVRTGGSAIFWNSCWGDPVSIVSPHSLV